MIPTLGSDKVLKNENFTIKSLLRKTSSYHIECNKDPLITFNMIRHRESESLENLPDQGHKDQGVTLFREDQLVMIGR